VNARSCKRYDHASNLTSIAPPSGSGSPQSYTYTSTNGITSATYDASGSPTLLGTNLYKWDGANRVVLFSNPASNIASRFVYDGFGRLVRVVDSQNGTVTADHSYTSCGSMRSLAHDNTQSGSPVSTQYFPQGVIVSGTSYYYVQDQLGSVTELVTSGGSVAVQYTYDPYGNRTTASGTAVSDIGYAGYFYHAASGLDFTLHRAYDPVHARWLNRGPIGEAGGVNLYAYVLGNPTSFTDPSGLLN
jgi:RHS repeat-associated protein